MTFENMDAWGRKKGVHLLGTGDFTHPKWFDEVKQKLIETAPGWFKLGKDSPVSFVLSAELSSIYSKGGKVRRIHNVLLAPSLDAVEKLRQKLEARGANLAYDGRPIIGLDAEELVKIAMDISEDFMIIPAHAWTPWFSVFGSNSGFDSVEECFGSMTKYIFAIETGLSADPAMCWRLSSLDRYTLVSHSDPHSLHRLGREANVFEVLNGDRLDYQWLKNILQKKDTSRFKFTVEFFPEEGRYHLDGHRACKVVLNPSETKQKGGICPVCKKPLTIGVMHRVEELADRPEGFVPEGAIPFKNLVPLEEIIADSIGVKSVSSKAVSSEYDKLVRQGGSEFAVLLDLPYDELAKMTSPVIGEGIRRVREGKLKIHPGYDGVYGTIKIFTDEERERFTEKAKQDALF
jgi:uncharacterized protein (TIGR00375 family)